jgi:hypothetical protein
MSEDPIAHFNAHYDIPWKKTGIAFYNKGGMVMKDKQPAYCTEQSTVRRTEKGY